MNGDDHEKEPRTRPRRGVSTPRAWRARTRMLVLSAVLFAAGVAFAFEPVVGMEFMLADANGTTLVGYGRLDEGGLQIRLARNATEVRVIVVGPDGSAQTYRGIFTEGRLQIVSPEGETTDVADALARSQQSLSLAWPDGEAAVVPPNDGAGSARAAAGADGEGSSAARPGAAADDDDASADVPEVEPPGGPTPAPGRPDDLPGRGPPDDVPGRGPGRGPPATPPGLDGRPGAPGRNLEADVLDFGTIDVDPSVVPEGSELRIP